MTFWPREYESHYSKVTVKRPVLLNNLVWIFSKISIKQPGPSQKKYIVLLYYRAARANIWGQNLGFISNYSENAQPLRIRIPKRRCYKERINLLGCLLVASKTNVLGGMASVIFEFDVRTARGSQERENSSLYYILPNCSVDNS